MPKSKDTVRSRKKKAAKRLIIVLIIIFLFFCVTEIANWMTEDDGSWTPDYSKMELDDIISKDDWSDEDYQTILLQTGLGKSAADVIQEKFAGVDRLREFEDYQEDFFTQRQYVCDVAVMIVHDERLRNEEGMLLKGFDIPDIRNGDIFITKSTHSFGWRHGHAAIVTDAAKGETLEALLLGSPSVKQAVKKWESYPSFIHLRLKDYDKAKTDEIAAFAEGKMLGIPYGLLSGIPVKAPENPPKTQCSHIVWYPYEHFGYDLDSDGFWLVSPKDITNSDLLEVVQVYGVDPREVWPGNLPF